MVERHPLRVVEIDVEGCAHIYGRGACSAALGVTGQHKCFDGYATCQDKAAFLPVTKTLRFCENVSGLPADVSMYPCLKSVSTNAAEINLSGISSNSTALGKRSRITVQLDDFVDSDLIIDKYASERRSGTAQADGIGYDPAERSTFLRKLSARYPYWNARPLRDLVGEVGQSLSAYKVRHHIMSDWTGPDAGGKVVIVAKDIFDLVEDDKAVLPSLSRGKLSTDLTTTDAALVLKPEGVGEEYPDSGRLCIGSEVAIYQRTGDIVTLIDRGVDGTEVQSHSADDLVQACIRFEAVPLPDAIHRALTEGDTGSIPEDWIDLDAWHTEAVGWLSGVHVTTTLAKPYSRRKLVGELCQFGALVWPDEVARKVQFRANRPALPWEDVPHVTDDGSFLEATGVVKSSVDERISRVFFWHGQMSVLTDPQGGADMRRAEVVLNQSAERDIEYGEVRIEEIATRWLGNNGNDAVASSVSERLASRYRDTPRIFEGVVDYSAAIHLSLGAVCRLTTRLIVDPVGLPATLLMQVLSIEEVSAISRVKVRLQTFSFDGRFGYWADAGAPDYDDADDDARASNAYWIDDAQADFGDMSAPYVWF